MFKPGELIKRKTISEGRAKAVCVIVEKDKDNYTLFNNSLNSIQTVACVVVNQLYSKVS